MRAASALFVCLAGICSPAAAADEASGKLLYEAHCATCHLEKLHDRGKTIVTSLPVLRAEVAKWSAQTGRTFSRAELDAIAAYLNASHYRLEK